MLDKPDFPHEKIIACLQAAYGLHIDQLAFLPLGGDLSTAVYRAVAADETPYFCKLKREEFDEVSVRLPKFLSEQGIAQVIPPLTTKTGQLWVKLNDFTLILYPFVTGTNGYELELTARQWAECCTSYPAVHLRWLTNWISHNFRAKRVKLPTVDWCRTRNY